jgi:tRNA(Ile)-lysidine synthase
MPSQPNNRRQRGGEKKLLRTVTQTIEENAMVQPGDSILVAVSGGPDSVALIHILDALAPILSVRLAIAHLNHGLRLQESERDAEFVASLARNLKLPLYLEKKDVRGYRDRHKLSPEEAARQVRYAFFSQVAEKNGFTKIAVGHHLDDNAELVLMFFLRGSGSLGLSGIPPVRGARIIRPLINIQRSEIIEYLDGRNLQYVSDTTNTNRSYLRNKIRHDLIPQLSSTYNPKIVDTLHRLASIARSEESWMRELIEPIFESALVSQHADSVRLSLDAVEVIPIAARRRLIRKAIYELKGDLRRITFSHIDAVVRLALKGPDTGCIDLPNRIRIQRNHKTLIILKDKQGLRSRVNDVNPAVCADYEYRITKPGVVLIKEAGINLKLAEIGIEEISDLGCAGQRVAFFDINKLKFPLVVRNFRPGDRFSPLGVAGTQKVKKFFINNKIPKEERAKCPLFVSEGKIVWVAGHRLDNSVKVDAGTRKVLKAELLLA